MKKIITALICLLSAWSIKAQSLYFPPNSGTNWDTLSPSSLGYCQSKIDSLYAFLNDNNTKSFILLKDGKIVLEKYFGTQTQSSNWQWASAGKTITAFMVGIAQQEGHLSITDTSADYLGQGWTSCSPAQEEKITIRHQLTMSSGLDDGTGDPYCTIDTCLQYKADAGSRWAYHNAPYTLLDSVIAHATGQTLNVYTTQKLKNPTGMTGLFVPIAFNNVFYSTARSMARFGLLILNKGNWNGNQIMTDTNYFQQMTNTSQSLNYSYGYLWWLNGKQSYMVPSSQVVFPGSICPNAPADLIAAMGKDGQFLNVVPSQNLVWMRMGEEPSSTTVPFLLNDEIWKYINELNCNTTDIKPLSNQKTSIGIFPNPCQDFLNIKSDETIIRLDLYNLLGEQIKSANLLSTSGKISISELANGIYLLKAHLKNGTFWTGKFVKK